MHNLYINNISIIDIFFYFSIYSFLGWCFEVAYAYTNKGYFVNRGFLYGPFCPIYGSGFISIVLLLSPVKDNLLLLYIFSTIITSTIEYFTALILEKLFNTKWWDYSDNSFNFHGRICLSFSLLWGLGSVIIIKIFHPIISFLVNSLNYTTSLFLFYIVFSYFLCDFALTILSLIKFNHKLELLKNIKDELTRRYSYILVQTKETALEKVQSIEDTIKELQNKYNVGASTLNLNHKRLLKAFPSMTSKKFNTLLDDLKQKIFKKEDL